MKIKFVQKQRMRNCIRDNEEFLRKRKTPISSGNGEPMIITAKNNLIFGVKKLPTFFMEKYFFIIFTNSSISFPKSDLSIFIIVKSASMEPIAERNAYSKKLSSILESITAEAPPVKLNE